MINLHVSLLKARSHLWSFAILKKQQNINNLWNNPCDYSQNTLLSHTRLFKPPLLTYTNTSLIQLFIKKYPLHMHSTLKAMSNVENFPILETS